MAIDTVTIVQRMSAQGVRTGLIAQVLDLDPLDVQKMLPDQLAFTVAEDDLIREGIRAVSLQAIRWALATFDEGGTDHKLRIGSLIVSRLMALLTQETPEALNKLRDELTALMQEEAHETARLETAHPPTVDQDEETDD